MDEGTDLWSNTWPDLIRVYPVAVLDGAGGVGILRGRRMTRERIEDMREVVLPFVTKRLMETNYENLGESDAKEFAKDFNEILALAIKGLEQEPTPKSFLGVDCIDRQATLDAIIKRLGIKNETYLLAAERAIYQQILAMPSVTPQLSSELEKNSKKLEKDFDESDCISRAEVLKLMQDNWHTHNGDWAMQESMDDIRALSSVTPQEPRKGHWIWCVGSHKCSNCEEYTCFSHEKLLRYCPNCGAKMESEE